MKNSRKIHISIGVFSVGCVLVFFLIYFGRLFQWQIIEGAEFRTISDENASYYIKIEAARGEIFDSNGNLLAGNNTVYSVVMNAITMDDNRNPAIAACLHYLQEDGVEWVDKLPITINGAGQYEFLANRSGEISYLKGTGFLNTQDYATAEECMTLLTERYGVDEYSQFDARNIISVRYNMTKTHFSLSEPYTIAEDVPLDTLLKISEHSDEMHGIEIVVNTKRTYEGVGDIAPHIVGTIGSINAEQYNYYDELGKTYSSSNVTGYSYSDTIGQSGIEDAFEETLRGDNGRISVELDTLGKIVKQEISDSPVAGDSVYLTLDSNLQRVANASLAENVKNCAYEFEDCKAGGVVVLDVETFGVLAASTYPSFDLERYSNDDDYYYNLLEDKGTPLFNRAFDGAFAPGSVFKPLVAIAALEEKVITDKFEYYCQGFYDYWEDYQPSCYDSLAHGTMDVYTGIMNSCNVFFFDVSRQLGIGKMNVYAKAFALGEKTGVEVGETRGIMANPQEYVENHGEDWVDGLTVQAGIGQSDSMFSPLQLAAYTATIANNGVRLKTHLYSKTVEYDGSRVLAEYEPEVVCDTEISKKTLDTVKRGMQLVAQSGTAYDTFAFYDIPIGCKTGTAENPGHTDNTVFIAYAPYDKPEIAVAVVLEYGKNGEYSRAVAKDIFDYYFFGEDNTTPVEQSTEEEKVEEFKRGDDIPMIG
ncbi:MAG: penicillin-binding transpeptidase domain-containing protein [Clostridia bacterium]|nr:penicillin-binding transpeptidase domain-containing protein [Clostridia bacterium]